ncbi:MAG: cyclic lactone autoinducer peptide [Lachnospiraceae bacterium]|nr:cyclic lactone autoinducer peptide [Lachnospiraceae bacterium]
MFEVKEMIANGMEKLAKEIAADSTCMFLWGEVEMPECLREEIEENDK